MPTESHTAPAGRRDRNLSILAVLGLASMLPWAGFGVPAIRAETSASGLVEVGDGLAGRPACFHRETRDDGTLEIGAGRDDAFVRFKSGEPRERSARNPIRVFAGARIMLGGKVIDRFEVLATFEGEARLTVPNPDRAGFLLQSSGNRLSFLAVVAAAKGRSLVIEARQKPDELEYVAVREFDAGIAAEVLVCAEQQAK